MNPNFDILIFTRYMTKLYDSYMDPIKQKFELSNHEIIIVSFLYNHPYMDTAKNICEIRMLSKGNVSAGVDSLVQKGYLEKFEDQDDHRLIHLKLTKQASKITNELEIQKDAFTQDVFGSFPNEELQQYFDMNAKILQIVDEKWKEIQSDARKK